jgi:hypothetical protein
MGRESFKYNQKRQDTANVADTKTLEHIDYYGEETDRIAWQYARSAKEQRHVDLDLAKPLQKSPEN